MSLDLYLKQRNGQIILASEGYSVKSGCENGIKSVRNNSTIDARYDRLVSKGRSPYFNLKAFNGQIIGTSEMYSSVGAMENGISSVKNNASDATVEELVNLKLKHSALN